MSEYCEQNCGMYTTWYSRGDGMHHGMYHGAPMIKTEAGVNNDCMMAVDYAPPIKIRQEPCFCTDGPDKYHGLTENRRKVTLALCFAECEGLPKAQGGFGILGTRSAGAYVTPLVLRVPMGDILLTIRRTDCSFPGQKAGASSAFVWSGGGVSAGGGQEQAATQAAAVPTGTTGGGGAQGLVHWMSVMAEHMGGGHHDPTHYALPPWNNGAVDHCQQKELEYAAWSRPRGSMTIKQGYEAKMSTGEAVGGHQKDDRHQSMSQMLYGAALGPGRSGSSSSSPVGGGNNSLLVVPQPLGKPTKLQPLHAHARKYHCKMCPQLLQLLLSNKLSLDQA